MCSRVGGRAVTPHNPGESSPDIDHLGDPNHHGPNTNLPSIANSGTCPHSNVLASTRLNGIQKSTLPCQAGTHFSSEHQLLFPI